MRQPEWASRILSEISQSQKGKYHMISLICGIYEQNKVMDINKTKAWVHGTQGRGVGVTERN